MFNEKQSSHWSAVNVTQSFSVQTSVSCNNRLCLCGETLKLFSFYRNWHFLKQWNNTFIDTSAGSVNKIGHSQHTVSSKRLNHKTRDRTIKFRASDKKNISGKQSGEADLRDTMRWGVHYVKCVTVTLQLKCSRVITHWLVLVNRMNHVRLQKTERLLKASFGMD